MTKNTNTQKVDCMVDHGGRPCTCDMSMYESWSFNSFLEKALADARQKASYLAERNLLEAVEKIDESVALQLKVSYLWTNKPGVKGILAILKEGGGMRNE